MREYASEMAKRDRRSVTGSRFESSSISSRVSSGNESESGSEKAGMETEGFERGRVWWWQGEVVWKEFFFFSFFPAFAECV